MRLLDEVVQHLLGDFKISDDAVLHRLDSDDVAGCAAEHLLRFLANGFNFARNFVHGDDGGLVNDDAFTLREHEGVSSAEVDGEIGRKETEKRPKVHLSCSKRKAEARSS